MSPMSSKLRYAGTSLPTSRIRPPTCMGRRSEDRRWEDGAEAVQTTTEITPSASRLTSSLRDIGYEFETALADIVDNCVAADATEVDIRITFAGSDSRVLIIDNGNGMDQEELHEALRFGSSRRYSGRDLGKFGLGLKTASLSQARRLTVVSRSDADGQPNGLILDLDHVEHSDRWEVLVMDPSDIPESLVSPLASGSGTVVAWEGLDRVLTYSNPDGEWARRRLQHLTDSAADYLAMVFHRFIEGPSEDDRRLKITINRDVNDPLDAEVLQAWDPYVSDEPAVRQLDSMRYDLDVSGRSGSVIVTTHVLPPKESFTSVQAFERAGGPLKWNRQQGLYIYRSGRLIQAGGWAGMRTLDEHLKLARVSIEFDPVLDPLFQVNVAKMRVSLPSELKPQIKSQISEVCHEADRIYRDSSASRSSNDTGPSQRGKLPELDVLFGLSASALKLGPAEFDTFQRVIADFRSSDVDSPNLKDWGHLVETLQDLRPGIARNHG